MNRDTFKLTYVVLRTQSCKCYVKGVKPMAHTIPMVVLNIEAIPTIGM